MKKIILKIHCRTESDCAMTMLEAGRICNANLDLGLAETIIGLNGDGWKVEEDKKK